jgi:ribosome-associated translation inhibitor RaiA
MELPIQVSFRHVSYSDAAAQDIRDRAAQLRRYDGTLLNCHVVVEQAHHHHWRGNRYHVRIEMSVPGQVIVIAHEPKPPSALELGLTADAIRKSDETAQAHKVLAAAIHEAFDEARRRGLRPATA